MKVASLIVALALALAWGMPVRPAPIAATDKPIVSTAFPTAGTAGTPSTPQSDDDSAAPAEPGLSTYLLLALGLFGMGLVSRRGRAD